MDSVRTATACLLIAATLTMGGCATSGMKGPTINMIDGAYEAPKSVALANDIQEILAEGGLNVSDPSAPTRETKVAEMATSKSSGEIETLVAALEKDASSTTADRSASPVVQVAEADTPPAPAALSLAAEKKQPQQIAVAQLESQRETVSFSYPEIGVAERRHEPSVAAAAMAPKPKPRKRAPAAAPSQKPAPKPEVAAPERKLPRRF